MPSKIKDELLTKIIEISCMYVTLHCFCYGWEFYFICCIVLVFTFMGRNHPLWRCPWKRKSCLQKASAYIFLSRLSESHYSQRNFKIYFTYRVLSCKGCCDWNGKAVSRQLLWRYFLWFLIFEAHACRTPLCAWEICTLNSNYVNHSRIMLPHMLWDNNLQMIQP